MNRVQAPVPIELSSDIIIIVQQTHCKMAKRSAEEQITKDNLSLQNDNDDSHGPSFATADVMAKRKILKPKGKGNLNSGANSELQFSAEGKTVAPFSSDIDINLKLKALNLMFVKAVTSVEDDALADYRIVVQKYIDYYSSIESNKASKTIFTPPVLQTKDFSVNGATESEKKNPFASIAFGKSTTAVNPVQNNVVSAVEESDSDSEDHKKQVQIDGPKFTMASKPTIKNSPFTFGSKPSKQAQDDSSDSEVEIKGPSFTFSKKIQDPVFKLVNESNKQGSGSLLSNNITVPFSPGEKLETSVSIPNFQFGTTSSTKETNGKPSLQFGNENVEVAEINPSLQTGTELLGNSETVRTGIPENSTQSRPAFRFGSAGSVAAFPSSSFGLGQTGLNQSSSTMNNMGIMDKQKSSNTPSFELKSAANSNESSGKGSMLFGSTPASTTKTHNFDQISTVKSLSSFVAGSQTGDTSNASKSVDLMPEEETEAYFEPVASLGAKNVFSVSNGEENEQVLFQRKSKLMLLDPKNKESPYKNLGIGELKVLKSGNGKSRLLMRADGGLRVLLNVFLLRDITYSTLGNGSLVRVPAVNSDGVLETFVLKVKSLTDGKELCDTLNEAKNC